MNIALPRTRTGKAPYFAALFAACALALVAGVGVWQGTDFGTSSSAPAARSLPFHFTPGSLALYIVDSDEQADLVRWGENEAALERLSGGIADPGYSVIIVKVTTPEDERNVAELVENWTASNSTVSIFDWRGH